LAAYPARLSGKARAACADPTNELYLSLASIWDLQIKLQLGKLMLRGDLSSILTEQQRNNRLRLLAYGYRDSSGVHRVVHRLEEAAQEDRDLAHRLQQLADSVSSVNR
jgi:PIN domain nuclease of toxin-antitoxin system